MALQLPGTSHYNFLHKNIAFHLRDVVVQGGGGGGGVVLFTYM